MISIFNILLIVFLILLIPTAYAGLIGAPYAPTFTPAFRRAFDYIKLSKKDTVVDLGSGDGKVVLEAAKRGAKGIGYELSPIFWAISWVRGLGVKNASFKMLNFYKKSLPLETTVIFAFLMPEHMDEVKDYLAKQNLPNGKYFMAYSFPLPKEVVPIHVVHEPKTGRVFIYDLKQLTKP